jgi:hypothetical protein
VRCIEPCHQDFEAGDGFIYSIDEIDHPLLWEDLGDDLTGRWGFWPK